MFYQSGTTISMLFGPPNLDDEDHRVIAEIDEFRRKLSLYRE
jgi:hypothetical protein